MLGSHYDQSKRVETTNNFENVVTEHENWGRWCVRQAVQIHSKELVYIMYLRKFWQDEHGQDLIEYTLLMAFVALASASLFIGAGGSIKGIWTTTNSQLTAANTQAC